MYPRTHRSLLALASTLALLAAAERADAACKTDMDCKGDNICDRGRCVSPTGGVVYGDGDAAATSPPAAQPAPAPAGAPPFFPPSGDRPGAKSTSTSRAQAAPSGVGASFTSEHVTSVAEPASGSTGFSIDGGYMFGTSTKSGVDMTMHFGTIGLGVKVLSGGKFPGPDGGSWSGFAIEPQVQGLIGGLVMGNNGAFIGGLNAGGVVGWQYLHFGVMDPSTLKQGGFGIQLGARLGYQHTWFDMSQTVYTGYGYVTVHQSGDSGDLSYGPNVQLTFPDYNAGTAHLTRGYMNFMLLPTGDFLMAAISGGAAF